MKAQNYVFEQRWRRLEAAKNQTRKVAYTLAIVLTSVVVAMTATAA